MTARLFAAVVPLVFVMAIDACGGDDGAESSSGGEGCPSGFKDCGGGCVSLALDPQNCGACGNACAEGEVCSQGTCASGCGGGTSACGGACVDTKVDPQNCGACSTACAEGEVCSGGACALSCGGGTTDCSGSCVNTQNDPAHCGGCAQACSPGDLCSGGVCALSCAGGTTECSGACINTQNDPAHCGGCDQACQPGEVCSVGACALSCAGGTTECSGACVNTQNDPAHCGGCNLACPNGEVCSQGACALSCVGGSTNCGGACVNTQNDPAHCGVCNTACPNGEVCSAGSCTLTCVGGTTKCGNACVDTQTNPAHCGACNMACGGSEACLGGSCVPINNPTSCKAIKTAGLDNGDGIYKVDPDGPGGNPAFDVYCDMTQNAGGWTLVARFANNDAQNWMQDAGQWWYDQTAAAGATTSRSTVADMYSPAFHTVVADELKLSRTDNMNDLGLLVTNNTCLGNKTFRAFITGFGNFKNVAWNSDAVRGTCAATLAGNYATTNGFQYATCNGNIGAPNSISFWADWSAGDGAVMMIGGGGSSCGRADHGIGITEANAASFFGISAASEDDFGQNGSNTSNNNAYALNLFVR